MQNLVSKVLFVENDDDYFNLIEKRFHNSGVFLMRAKNGFDALSQAFSEIPSIIVTSVMVPDLNGFEIIRKIKDNEKTRNTTFVILTNYGETRYVYDENFLSALGVAKYLIKSNHTPQEVIKEIKSLL